MFKIIIAGGRDFIKYDVVRRVCDAMLSKTTDAVEIVSGGCSSGLKTHERPDGSWVCGADGLGERYAEEKGLPVKLFIADWKTFPNSAGPVRNWEMADYSNALIAFWDGQSKGTADIIRKAKEHGRRVRVFDYAGNLVEKYL